MLLLMLPPLVVVVAGKMPSNTEERKAGTRKKCGTAPLTGEIGGKA